MHASVVQYFTKVLMMDIRRLKLEKQNERDRRVIEIADAQDYDFKRPEASPIAALVRARRKKIRIEFR
ncbi:hypothetical protein M5M_03022 [Simiduia agarivorans SA1 = DSM 21679]|uniref:Uncharacterized protein n=1 Tax=Simiduia agarivorans (strain DSM 21679 / JCM 13881 / BCRC 17597 / SA1) TaxID=1117647 RepID=R9S396_SIMAS|nr:hypothetical protein M5M_03022 [Simiduia agarivorans SA1 = DSM 21679]